MIFCVFLLCPQRPINFIIIPQISGHGKPGPMAAMLARVEGVEGVEGVANS